MSHPATVYSTLEQFLASRVSTDRARRRAVRRWKLHVERNGNVPLVEKCSICSGRELRDDVKRGRFKPSRPTKGERDEARGAG